MNGHLRSILEVFPPGPRRAAVLALAEHPEFDDVDWEGVLIFRRYRTHKEGKPGLSLKIEPKEENVL